MYTLRFDGLFREMFSGESQAPGSRAGFMCYGWLIYQNGELEARGHGGFAHSVIASSIGAEYLGLVEGLEALLDLGVEDEEVVVLGDAKSVIQQMQGASAVNSEMIKPLYKRARRLARHFSRLQWAWEPRRLNHAADLLTRRALQQMRANPSRYQAACQVINPHNERGGWRSRRLYPVLGLRVYHPA